MKYHPLQLKQVFIREVVSKPAATSNFAKTIDLTVNPVFGRGTDDPGQWQVAVDVIFQAGKGESDPLQYSGHIEVMGIFRMDPTGMDEKRILQTVAVNATTMLYSTARETLANLTARGPHGAYLLPTITFSDQTLTLPATPKEKDEEYKAPAKAGKR